MRRLVLVLSLLAVTAASPAVADEVWTINGNATFNGQPGLVLRVDEVGFPWVEFHTYVDANRNRINATRDQGVTSWTTITPATYLCPTTTMTINDSWVFLETDFGDATTATVKALEPITVPAGTFNAYRVEVTLNSNPSIKDAIFWFVDGVGIVRQEYYDSTNPTNAFDGRTDLTSFSIVGGSGYFPAAVGNTWTFADIVANEAASFGKVKALYQD